MKNRILSGGAVNLTIVALLVLLFAGCGAAPKAENLSMATVAAHMRADVSDDVQPNSSDSPEFSPWGGGRED